MVQLASISMDPFFSRLNSLAVADFAAIDLDPADGVTFEEVLDVARRVHDELVKRKVPCFPKTSGSRGLHIFIPLPPKTPYKAGQLFCRIISTFVADKMPSIATVERTVNRRGRKIYLDYLQNIEGKTLAAAYSARASEYAGASTPLTWDEVHDGFSREAFTFRALPARLARVGDLWAKIHNHPGFDLMATLAG
jgi:bifunctional non-homologous end joining protein LigD